MYELYKLIKDTLKQDLEDSWKESGKGVCQFCGRKTTIGTNLKVRNIYKSKLRKTELEICKECSIVYENSGKVSTYDIFQNSKIIAIDVNTMEYVYPKKISEINKMSNISFWLLLRASKMLPLNLFERDVSIIPNRGLVINVIAGSKLFPIMYDTKDLLLKISDPLYTADYVINFIRKSLQI